MHRFLTGWHYGRLCWFGSLAIGEQKDTSASCSVIGGAVAPSAPPIPPPMYSDIDYIVIGPTIVTIVIRTGVSGLVCFHV